MDNVKKYKQLSIYDFLDGESQEVAPSETIPQVDETQDSHELPSSDLDTRKNWEIVQDAHNEFFEKPTDDEISYIVFTQEIAAIAYLKELTEDTDKTSDKCQDKPLFSVGDVCKVVNTYEEDTEDFGYLTYTEGKTVKVESILEGIHSTSYECSYLHEPKRWNGFFKARDLVKI
jgi:hypothetical protein